MLQKHVSGPNKSLTAYAHLFSIDPQKLPSSLFIKTNDPFKNSRIVPMQGLHVAITTVNTIIPNHTQQERGRPGYKGRRNGSRNLNTA